VLDPAEALFFRGGNKLAVDDERCRGIAVIRVQAKNCEHAVTVSDCSSFLRILATVSLHFERFNACPKVSETAVLISLPATVCAFAMGSSSVNLAMRIGGPLRWILLCVLAACATPFGMPYLSALHRRLAVATASLVGVALLSAFWSVTPRLSAEHAMSFAVMMAGVALLVAGASHSRARVERLLIAVLGAVDVVGIAGLVVLVIDHQTAVQPGGVSMPARMRGFGQNPNTCAMLFALALPIAEWLVVSTQRLWIRFTAGASCVLLYGSIMASGSRGALLAAAAGTVLFLGLMSGTARRIIPLEAIAIVFFLGTFQVAGTRTAAVPPGRQAGRPPVTDRHGPSGASPATLIAPATSRFRVGIMRGLTKADVGVPFVARSNEIGSPPIYQYKPITSYGSGRVFAWLWAVRQGLEVPVLGYGFGSEAAVFVDRFYLFESSLTENSFVGMFLQLGIVGVLLLLLPFLVVGQVVLRAVRRDADNRSIVAAAAGVVGAGFVVAFFQSYLYSVGNLATLTLWLAIGISVLVAEHAPVRSGP
jgi:hypothetical protein